MDPTRDEHSGWEFNLRQMTATLWTEGAPEQWECEIHPIRNEQGTWEYFVSVQQWRSHLDLLEAAERMWAREDRSMFPEVVRESAGQQDAELRSLLADWRDCGPGWFPFHSDVAEAIDNLAQETI